MQTKAFQIQRYTHKELAAHYNCSRKTLRTWLRPMRAELGPREGHFYTPRQVGIIVERLGEPWG